MKKLILLTIVTVCILTSCQKETVSLPEDIAAKKVYVQVVAYNSDGTSYSSEIEIAQ